MLVHQHIGKSNTMTTTTKIKAFQQGCSSCTEAKIKKQQAIKISGTIAKMFESKEKKVSLKPLPDAIFQSEIFYLNAVSARRDVNSKNTVPCFQYC